MTDYIDIRWHVEDIEMCAEDNEIEITREQALEALLNLKHNHDATVGINWDVILCEINEVVSEHG